MPEAGFGAAFAGRGRAPTRVPLSIGTILEAAVAILDAGGAEALTFRRLAQDLGVGVASLYWHVESKDVLLDLALDRVLGEIKTDDRAARAGDWAAKARYSGLVLYRTFVAHRWAAAQMILSSDRGPNTLRLWEYLAGAFLEAGFSIEQGFDGLSLIMNHVLASGVQEASWATLGSASAAERRKVLASMGDFLRSLDPEQFPAIVASADVFANHDQAKQFADALDLIIAGLGQQLATSANPGKRRG